MQAKMHPGERVPSDDIERANPGMGKAQSRLQSGTGESELR